MSDKTKSHRLNTLLNKDFLEKSTRFEYHPWFEGFRLIQKNWDYDSDFSGVSISIVMPIYNKSYLIEEQLSLLLNNISVASEIIIIDDASTDGSVDLVVKLIATKYSGYYTILRCDQPIYETAADNIGFYLGSGKFVCDVQSDMLIYERGFDLRMMFAMEKFNFDTLSGRCGHVWSMLTPKKYSLFANLREKLYDKFFSKRRYVGKAGLRGFEKQIYDHGVYLVNTNNRGPWMIRRAALERHDYLDQSNFFLGDDDHDLNIKVTKAGGIIGYISMDVYSRASDGSTRQPRNGLNKTIYDWYKKNRVGSSRLYEEINNSMVDSKPLCLSEM